MKNGLMLAIKKEKPCRNRVKKFNEITISLSYASLTFTAFKPFFPS